MRKPLLSRKPLILLAACLACILSLPLSGRRTDPPLRPASTFHDWSTRHVVYPRVGPMAAMQAAAQDPRAFMGWRSRFGWPRGGFPGRPPRGFPGARIGMHQDWSINLGAAGTAPAMYPAKFSFDITAAPSCLNDFIIFPVNATGTATQPNLVAFNNLYSGTAGGNGICNRTPVGGTDTGTAATVLWSYNVQGIAGGGAVPTSPALSFDPLGATASGAKVAFVESATGSPAHFHVLAWKNGDGQNANLQNVLTPKTVNAFVSAAPAAGSGTATDLALGAATTGTDTLSSPFVDYVRDVAYVGNDIGTLYRIKDVFCTGVNPDCAGPPPAPSLDTSWGSGGSVTVCIGKLTAPILDFVTLNVFVGCGDGKLYMISPTGTTVTSLTVGDGTAFGGIVDPPVVDGVNGFVYAVSGSNGTNATLVQAKTDLSASRTATLGAANVRNVHAPAFNDNYYFSNPTSTNWVIFACSYNAAGTTTILYAVGFDGSRNLNTGTPPAANQSQIRGSVTECSPLSEFLNGATDWLFLSRLAAGNIRSFDVTNVTSAGFPGGFTRIHSSAQTGGTSGIIVDNESAATQASSIYFSRLGSRACGVGGTGRCAVKLTQAGFQ